MLITILEHMFEWREPIVGNVGASEIHDLINPSKYLYHIEHEYEAGVKGTVYNATSNITSLRGSTYKTITDKTSFKGSIYTVIENGTNIKGLTSNKIESQYNVTGTTFNSNESKILFKGNIIDRKKMFLMLELLEDEDES